MLKSQLIEALAEAQPAIAEYLMSKAVNHLIDLMSLELSQGRRIEIRGFGTFTLSLRASRLARNPKTGQTLTTPPKYILRFRPGKPFRDRIKPKISLLT